MPDIRILVFRQEAGIEAVLLQDGRPWEWLVERSYAMNDVFLGVCSQISGGMSSAFIDIGTNHDAVLPLSLVKNAIQPGQPIPVQVCRIRDEDGKGPAVDVRIRLPGRYAVVVPGGKTLRRSCLSSMEPKAAEEKFRGEEAILKNTWLRVESTLGSGTVPRPLLRLGDPASIALREWDAEAPVLVEGTELFGELDGLAAGLEDRRRLRLHVPGPQGSLWSLYGLESHRRERDSERVPLPSGGSLSVQRTSALTAIDVNSGSATAANPSELACIVNNEAVDEAARQLRLRNLSGTVMIDFLRTHNDQEAQSLTARLVAATAGDRGKVRVEGLTKLGLMEVARSGF